MTNPDCISIREQLSQYPGSKLGFVVYRLTYSDDARWVQFMDYLNTRIRLGLEKTGDGDLFQHIDWDVQEDPALEEAEEPEVRKRSKKYLEENSHSQYGSRAMACIAVSQFELDQNLDYGPPPEKFDTIGLSCVQLISINPRERRSSYQMVGLSFVFPRAYSLLELGWHQINAGPEDMFTN